MWHRTFTYSSTCFLFPEGPQRRSGNMCCYVSQTKMAFTPNVVCYRNDLCWLSVAMLSMISVMHAAMVCLSTDVQHDNDISVTFVRFNLYMYYMYIYMYI